ncbi:MAG: hypothetical protein K8T89_04885, partial [Planctomycetes bacterium]|nr:hypothetical protein [Planctomycetota bacterium]
MPSVLQLNGATISGVENTLLKVDNAKLIIRDQFQKNRSTTQIRLGVTNGAIQLVNNGVLAFQSQIVEQTAGSSLTFSGIGNAEFHKKNLFTGGVSNTGDIGFLLTHAEGFGSGTVQLGNHSTTTALSLLFPSTTTVTIANNFVLGTNTGGKATFSFALQQGFGTYGIQVEFTGTISGGAASQTYLLASTETAATNSAN